MDILRLPPPLRRSLLSNGPLISHLRRTITTEPHNHPFDTPPLTTSLNIREDTSPILQLTSTTLNSYKISPPPNPLQLKHASTFFHKSPPELLYSTHKFRSLPPSPFPEVAFLGRSNVGKSSLLNAIFGRTKIQPAHVSKKAGRTRTMNGWGVAGGISMGAAPAGSKWSPEKGDVKVKDEAWRRFPRGGLVVIDMPGYGSGSQAEWGAEAVKILLRRKQLRRTFILVDGEHGLKNSDIELLKYLRQSGVSFQIVLSKVDKVLYSSGGNKIPAPEKLHERLVYLAERCGGIKRRLGEEIEGGIVGDILCCSAEQKMPGENRKLGVDEVRWAILAACGMESDELGAKKRSSMEDITVLEEDELLVEEDEIEKEPPVPRTVNRRKDRQFKTQNA